LKPINLISNFSKNEFYDLCTTIIQNHIITYDLANPGRYTTPFYPIINITEDSVHLQNVEGITFNYNIMSYDETPGDYGARIVSDLYLFQVKYFETNPATQQDCISLLERTLLSSLDVAFRHIAQTNQRIDFHYVDYIFLSNMEFDLSSIDYIKWITNRLEVNHPKVNFQIGTNVSILNALNSVDYVRERYFQIINKNSPVLILPSKTGLKAVAFDSLGLTRLEDVNANIPLSILARSSSRVREIDKAIEQLNDLLSNINASEEDFHHFFEQHPIFLTGLSYKDIQSKIVLEREGAGPLIPDFFMEPVSSSLWDILDIKRPKAKLWSEKKNRDRFSSNVYDVVAQLREYGDYFDVPAHRELVQKRYGIYCYKPRLIAVIGSKASIDDESLRKAQRDLSSVTIRTYDEIVSEVYNIREWLAKE
jgi:hypothetical protein